jgi:hypothetical protein
MAQQLIDFGTFPNDPTADPLRAAFQKIQNNFTELYNATQATGVQEIGVGPGLAQNRTTGNVFITANIPNITIQTANSLLVGVGAATGNSATITSSVTPFVINLANTITTSNANITNNVRAGNLQIVGNVTTNINPNINNTLDIGTNSLRWRDVYVGNSIRLGQQLITANTDSFNISNLNVQANILSGNISVTSNIASNNLSVSNNITVANINVTASVNSNLRPQSNNTFDLGNTANRWRTLFVGNATVTSNISAPNLNVSTDLTTANLTVSQFVRGNLIPEGQEIYDLGTPTRRWRDLFLSGNSLSLGDVTITSDGSSNSILIPSLVVNSNISAGNITSTFVSATILSPDQPNITSLGVLSNLQVAGNLQTGELQVAGNLSAATLNVTGAFSAGTITGNIIIPPGAVLTAPGDDTQLLFNDGGNTAAVPGMTFNKTTSLLSIQGNVSGANLISSGSLDVVGNANVGNVNTSALNAQGNVNAGNLITIGILATTGGIESQGNIATNGFLNVVGNASIGNITTVTLSGQVVSVSGNVSGANLIATGIMRVDGNANVGNLTTSGFVSAATMEAQTIATNALSVSGNLSGTNLIANGTMSVLGNANVGNLSTATINASLLNANGNINVADTLNAATISATGNMSISGAATILGNATIGNVQATLLESTLLSVSGNIVGGNVTSGNVTVSGTALMGNIVANNQLIIQNAATIATSMNVGANIAITTISGSGAPANTVTVTFAEQTTVPFPVGATIVIENTTPVGFTGTYTVVTSNNSSVTYSSSQIGTASVPGRIRTGGLGLRVTGNASLSNLEIAGLISASTSTANLGTVNSGILSVTGNASAGNLQTPGTLSVTGNAFTGNLTTNQVSAGNLSIQQAANITRSLTVGANLNLTSISGNGTVITAGYATQSFPPFPVGTQVSITGVTPSGYNGTYTVSTASNSAVTFSGSTTGTATVLGRITTGGTALNISGNATIGNIQAAAFTVDFANANTISIPAGGLLSMATANANIGNLATTALNVAGNLNSANLIASGFLSVSGNASANRITVATGVVTGNHSVSGALNIGTVITVTGASGTGSTATLTFTAQTDPPFPIGSTITVAGITPTGYNGTFTVTACTTTSVSYTSSATGVLSVQGTVRSSGTGLILAGAANVGSLFTNGGNISAGNGNITGGIFTATLFSGNGASITGINMFNTGMSVVVTATAGTGSIATLSFDTQSYPPFSVGQQITVSGLVPSGYNGIHTVLSCTTTQVTFSSSTTGSMSTSGTIVGGPKAQASLVSDSVISSSQPNITSLGTLTGLNVNGNFNGTNIFSSGFVTGGVTTGINANGITLAAATGLTTPINIVATATANTNDSIRLPGASAGMQVIIVNTTNSPLRVFPANGARIDNANLNISFPLGAGARLMLVAATTTQWYTMTGVYG